MSAVVDALVTGGGPAGLAGLAGALYLARFRRCVIVVDAGHSRAVRIPRSHNVAGFADGVAGDKLLDIMRCQVRAPGAQIVSATVDTIEGSAVAFRAWGPDGRIDASTVLLATGASGVLCNSPAGVAETLYLRHFTLSAGAD